MRRVDTRRASASGGETEVRISARCCLMVVGGAILALAAVHLLRAGMLYGLGVDRFGNILSKFNLNSEAVIPSWFSSLLLAASAVIVLSIAAMKHAVQDRHRLGWLLMGLTFVYLSVDEAAMLHEMWGIYLNDRTDWTGAFFYRPTLPNMIMAGVVGLALLPLVLSLGLATKIRLAVAVGLYLGGAIGVEMLGAAQHADEGTKNLRYELLVAVEETLEMGGALMLAATFLHYLRTWTDRPRLTLAP